MIIKYLFLKIVIFIIAIGIILYLRYKNILKGDDDFGM